MTELERTARREIDKDASILSSQLTGYVGQIAKEPSIGLGHIINNVAKLESTILEAGRTDLLTILQNIREVQLELQFITGSHIGATQVEGQTGQKSRNDGAGVALDSAMASAHEVIAQIKLAKQSRAVAMQNAQPNLNLLLTNNPGTSTNDEKEFSQWYGRLFDSPQKDHENV